MKKHIYLLKITIIWKIEYGRCALSALQSQPICKYYWLFNWSPVFVNNLGKRSPIAMCAIYFSRTPQPHLQKMTLTLSCLPTDIITEMFRYIDHQTVLSLRQLNKEWLNLIDGDDISRFLLYYPSFTFRGKHLKDYPETIKYSELKEYGKCMHHLSSRLQALDSEGPRFVYSIPHPSDHKFCYGRGLLALEIRKGDEIEIREVEYGKRVYRITLASVLGEAFVSRYIADMRIRDSILSLSVNESRSANEHPERSAFNFVLFFALRPVSAELLLKVPRRRERDPGSGNDRDCMYDFNTTMAVICTYKDDIGYSASVWSLETGTLTMSHINLGGFDCISVGKHHQWSSLRRLMPKRGAHCGARAFPNYRIRTFSSDGCLISKSPSLPLFSFPNDRRWSEESLPIDGPLSFHPSGTSENACGVIWRQPIQGTWKVRIYIFDKLTNKPISGFVILSEEKTCFGDRVYVNFDSEFLIIPHNSVSQGGIPKLSYLSLRQGRQSKTTSDRRQTIHSAYSVPVTEDWFTCDEACHRVFPGNTRRGPRNWAESESCKDMIMQGDETVFLCSMGNAISVFKFDACRGMEKI